jgi:uncharacterized membrane protein YhaH (DUF805 family)
MFADVFISIALAMITPVSWLAYSLVHWLIGVSIICFLMWILFAAEVRRLHDIGLSGNWCWPIWFLPGGGPIGALFLLLLEPDMFNKTKYEKNSCNEKSL